MMEEKNKINSHLNEVQKTLFGFELNHSQFSLFLVTSFIGIFMLPYLLSGDIFLNLFQFIFQVIPDYIEHPEARPPNYLVYMLCPIIVSIIVSTIFLFLSIYALKKLLMRGSNENRVKGNIIPQERVVNWFGLKLSHGQSLFIFSLSLAGMLFTIQMFINYLLGAGWEHGLFESLCYIPDGPNSAISHMLLIDNVPLAILAFFFLLCIISIIQVHRTKPKYNSKRNIKNYGLLLFIFSFVILIFLSARIFCHLALFNLEISGLLGISYSPPNSYQNNDFIITLVLFCILLSLIITSFLLKEKKGTEIMRSEDLSWLHIKLTPYRATALISSAILFIIFLTTFFLSFLFMISFFSFQHFLINWYYFIFILLIIFCYYPIGKVLKNNSFNKIMKNMNKSNDFEVNWFNFHLNKRESVIMLSISSALAFLYIFLIFSLNMQAQSFLFYLDPSESYLLFSFPIMTALLCLILGIIGYTIKKTFPSIKSH